MQNLQKTWTSDFENIITARPQGHVLAVCLHPALDVTVYTKNGRETGRHTSLGGKAINLARMLHALGARVTLLAPDDREKQTSRLLADCGFAYELIPTDLSLRHNYKYVDADNTTREQNGSAGTLSPQDFTQLLDRIIHSCRTGKFSHLSLCGSFPQGVEKDVYKCLITQAKALNISCVADTSGDALSLAVQAKPCLIKPNLEEFCRLRAQDLSMLKIQKDLQAAVFQAYKDTCVPLLCSMDKRGAIYAGSEGIFTLESPEVQNIGSFAGAGDTMLASFMYARMLCGASITDALRFCSATATAKVRLVGDALPNQDQIYAEWTQTKVRKVIHEIY